MDSDKIVKGQKVYLGQSHKCVPASLLIRNSKIQKIGSYEDAKKWASELSLNVIDAGEASIIPGFFDTHAHINEPGRTDWEGFQSATRAAAAGGITSVVDMPLNSIPATTSLAALKIKRESAKNHCAINYAFWGGLIPGNFSELLPMILDGVIGFKCFLCPSGVDEFPHVGRKDLEEAMPLFAEHQIPLIVHAELESAPRNLQNFPSDSYESYLQTRPPQMELDAIELMMELCEKYRGPVHIVHLSTAEALEKIRVAKEKGLPFTVETCPHYLHFSAEDIASKATHFKCAPPIRNSANREALWQGIEQGLIDFIVSDHSPCVPSLKCFESGNFVNAWGGIAGLQMSPLVVWTEMKKRNFKVPDLLKLMSAKPAAFAGFSDSRGVIDVGYCADLVFFEEESETPVNSESIFHKHKVSPYVGERLSGKIAKTLVGGKTVFSEGNFVNSQSGVEIKRKVRRGE